MEKGKRKRKRKLNISINKKRLLPTKKRMLRRATCDIRHATQTQCVAMCVSLCVCMRRGNSIKISRVFLVLCYFLIIAKKTSQQQK